MVGSRRTTWLSDPGDVAASEGVQCLGDSAVAREGPRVRIAARQVRSPAHFTAVQGTPAWGCEGEASLAPPEAAWPIENVLEGGRIQTRGQRSRRRPRQVLRDTAQSERCRMRESSTPRYKARDPSLATVPHRCSSGGAGARICSLALEPVGGVRTCWRV